MEIFHKPDFDSNQVKNVEIARKMSITPNIKIMALTALVVAKLAFNRGDFSYRISAKPVTKCEECE